MEYILIFLSLLLFILPLSIRTTIVIFFICMSVEGFLKHLSMYHPIAHGFKYIIPLIIYIKYLLGLFRNVKISTKTNLTNLINLYFVIVMLQLFNPLNYLQGLGGVLLTFVGFMHHLVYIPLFFISFSILESKEDIYKLILPLVFILGLLNLFALVQMYQGLDFYANLSPSFYKEYHHYGYTVAPTEIDQPRPFSTYTTPYSLAIACMIEIFLCWSFMWQRKNINNFLFWTSVLFFSVSCAALIFTYVRTVLLEVIIGFLIVLIIRKGKALLRLRNICLILVAIWLFFKIVPTFNIAGRDKILTIRQPFAAFKASRGHLLENALEVFKEYPFGVGLGRSLSSNLDFFYKMESREREFMVAESNFIVILGDLSFIGLLIAILIFKKIIISGYKIVKRIKDSNLIWLGVSLFGLLVAMVFNCPISIAFDGAYFWFLSGILLSLDRLERDNI